MGQVRQIFKDALDEAARKKQLGKILSKALKSQPLEFFGALARFLPKDINLNDNRAPLEDLTDEELAHVVAEARRLAAAGGERAAAPKRKGKVR